jgi:four helix bundle protein
MVYQSFRELRVWQEGKDLAVRIYRLTSKGMLSKDYGLKDQMQRAAVSIPCNIAEGYERNSNKDFVRFLMIAKGSLSELRTLIEIAYEIGYLTKSELEEIGECSKKLGAMMTKLIQSRKNRLTDSP